MKKTVSIILSLALALCLAACGDSGGTTAEVTPAATPSETAAEGTELSTEFWNVTYSDDWTYDKDNDFYESDGYYACVTLSIMDGDEAAVSVYIDATVESPSGYRDYLKGAGIDAYDMVENGSVDLVNVGGVDCVESEGEYWGDPTLNYYGRDEGAGATVMVEITGDTNDPRVSALLGTLNFTLEDTGNVDPPWPWNGEPFSAESTLSHMVGGYTVTSQWIPIDKSLVTDDIFSGRTAVVGDTVYVLLDGVLKQYSYDGGSLAFEQDLDLPSDTSGDTYEEICSDNNGVLYLSGFMMDFIGIKDGEQIFSYSGPDNVAMHPSGTWGISWFAGPDVEKITLTGDSELSEDWTFEEIDTISSVCISENHIFVSGSAVSDDEQTIFVYDLDGNLQYSLGSGDLSDDDCLGSVTQVIETANSFIGLDGNMRSVCFWNTDGSFIGSLGDDDLFGTYYPWISAAALMPDGSVLVGMTEEREDESADEFIVFRLSGF